MQVSIIIVNFNTKNLLKNCLLSIIEKTKNIEFEIIVSDNGSQDGSIEMLKKEFPNVILIENNENLGFGKANNRGLKSAKGKYILYLNSDTVLLNNAVKLFYDYWENAEKKEEIGALGTNLFDEKMNLTHSYGSFPNINQDIKDEFKSLLAITKHTLKFYLFRKRIPSAVQEHRPLQKVIGEVDFITGADLFMRNDGHAFFDENIFLYCEDVDLQYELSKKNLKRILINGPEIQHLEGGSTKKILNKVTFFSSISSIYGKISLLYFYRKNKISNFKIQILKCIIKTKWKNPLIKNSNKNYLKLLEK